MDEVTHNAGPRPTRSLKVDGRRRLSGTVDIGGSKQGVLHILGALLLADGTVTLRNVPNITDVHDFLTIYHTAGVSYRWRGDDLVLGVHTHELTFPQIDTSPASRFRSSILLLGSALVRGGSISFPQPGGCRLGERSLKKYCDIAERFGYEVKTDRSSVHGSSKSGPHPKNVELDLENKGQNATALALILAAGMKGHTMLVRPLKAPAIDNLINFLRLLGVRIVKEAVYQEVTHVWSPGVEELKKIDMEHAIGPDGPEMVFWIAASALTHGRIRMRSAHVKFENGNLGPLGRIQHNLLNRIGIPVQKIDDNMIEVNGAKARLKPLDIKTSYDEYEGITIDCAPHLIPVLATVRGRSLYEDIHYGTNRVAFVKELRKLGVTISFKGNGVEIHGSPTATGASVRGGDIRATACLVLAALGAQGVSYVRGFELVERAYHQLADKLLALGASVEITSRNG